jgi:nucleolar protein 12
MLLGWLIVFCRKQFHEERSNINAYVVFKSEDSVEKALQANGETVHDHHIRVDRCAKQKVAHDQKKAIFLGNLPFGKVIKNAFRLQH